jgi:Galactose oxidase, central domain
MEEAKNLEAGMPTIRISARRMSSTLRLGFFFSAAAVLAGCASSTSISAAQPSTVASTRESPAASMPAIATATPVVTPAQSPNPGPLTFVATGSMHTARAGATATLLANGKVLVAGGANLDSTSHAHIYNSAELYDPATGQFSTTGSMTAARSYATAKLLGDGRVLIAGGDGCPDARKCSNVNFGTVAYLTSAELYDPATGEFAKTGSMPSTIVGGAATTLLPDGRVLVATMRPALYDPSLDKFIAAGKGTVIDTRPTATLLPNGKVLVTGDSGGATVARLYDEATDTFTAISLALPAGTPLVQGYDGVVVSRLAPSSAALLKDGRVLLFEGGYLETYDPASGACSDAGFLSSATGWPASTAELLSDGRVLFQSDGAVVLYDPAGGPTGTGSVGPAHDTETRLQDDRVLFAGGLGGVDGQGPTLASAVLLNP